MYSLSTSNSLSERERENENSHSLIWLQPISNQSAKIFSHDELIWLEAGLTCGQSFNGSGVHIYNVRPVFQLLPLSAVHQCRLCSHLIPMDIHTHALLCGFG